MKGPTINDVARAARVGKTSVSRYLNGEHAVLSEPLRKRIEAAIEALGYRPSQMARGLKHGRTRLIGLLMADLRNPYSVDVMQGVEASCRRLGLMPLLCNAANEAEIEARYLDLLRTYRVEGLIINPVGMDEVALRTLTRAEIPMVLVDRRVDGVRCDLISLDNAHAAQSLAQHLCSAGFQEIHYVTEAPATLSPRREREAAFQAAVSSAGAHVTRHTLARGDEEHAGAIVRTALASAKRPLHTALVSSNGQTMLRLALSLQSRGEEVCTPLGLACFDDPEWVELAHRGITTVRQPCFEIGSGAVEMLAQQLQNKDADHLPLERLLPGTLRVRRSTLLEQSQSA